MKYLKSGKLRHYALADQGWFISPNGKITTNSTHSLKLPAGATSERPGLYDAQPGMMRYNTETKAIETYLVDGLISGWEVVKAPATSAIVKQTIAGHSTETHYGPLVQVPASINNIIVIVENVLQVGTENFTLVTDPSGTSPSRGGAAYPSGTYIRFTGAESVPDEMNITVLFGFEN